MLAATSSRRPAATARSAGAAGAEWRRIPVLLWYAPLCYRDGRDMQRSIALQGASRERKGFGI